MSKKQQQIRMLLIREAARLMVEENVSQYLDAKKLAVKRLFGKRESLRPHPPIAPQALK